MTVFVPQSSSFPRAAHAACSVLYTPTVFGPPSTGSRWRMARWIAFGGIGRFSVICLTLPAYMTLPTAPAIPDQMRRAVSERAVATWSWEPVDFQSGVLSFLVFWEQRNIVTRVCAFDLWRSGFGNGSTVWHDDICEERLFKSLDPARRAFQLTLDRQ